MLAIPTLLSFFLLTPFPAEAKIIIQAAPAVLVAPLIPVCGCESAGDPHAAPTQWDENGNVLHGAQNPDDIGMCQINVSPRNGNIQQAEKLGFDVYTEQGNIKMANWLYAHQGLQPWHWSKSCWDK